MKHGRWCRLRSFPMKCKFCGAKLLYWECEHGCKLLFEFDKNGRLAGHHKCSGSMANIRPSRKLRPRPPTIAEAGFDVSSVSKAFIEKLFREAFQCPVCKEKFTSETGYYQHLHQKRSHDDAHDAFYLENKRLIENIEPDAIEASDGSPSPPATAPAGLGPGKVTTFPTEPSTINTFGGIRFKGKDGTVKLVKNYRDWWGEFSENGGQNESRR